MNMEVKEEVGVGLRRVKRRSWGIIMIKMHCMKLIMSFFRLVKWVLPGPRHVLRPLGNGQRRTLFCSVLVPVWYCGLTKPHLL